jgi:hypothetical protein
MNEIQLSRYFFQIPTCQAKNSSSHVHDLAGCTDPRHPLAQVRLSGPVGINWFQLLVPRKPGSMERRWSLAI